MSLLVPSSSHARHEPLPSLSPPPTPTEEEDLATASSGPWRDDQDEAYLMVSSGKSRNKGKGKAREVVDLNNDDDDGAESYGTLTPVIESDELGAVAGYPPTTEEEEESKRIAENLRRWEQAERQRRKAARESATIIEQSSVVGEVSKRASYLWPVRRAQRALNRNSTSSGSASSGIHSIIRARNSEDAVALAEIEGQSSPGSEATTSPGTSKPPSPPNALRLSTTVTEEENPFETPTSEKVPQGPFENGAVMKPSASPPPPTPAAAGVSASPFDDPQPRRPTLQASASSFTASRHPPPQPIDIPPPKTPPPRTFTPAPGRTISQQPGPIGSPSTDEVSGGVDERDPAWKKRWWTDWLCGCREGPDRGGDDQAGRTNPFE